MTGSTSSSRRGGLRVGWFTGPSGRVVLPLPTGNSRVHRHTLPPATRGAAAGGVACGYDSPLAPPAGRAPRSR